MILPSCPLCWSCGTEAYHQDKKRQFWQCKSCQLVFVSAWEHVELADEKKEYNLHENYADDVGYQKFLSRMADPLSVRLASGAAGLDVGCGPAPALQKMLQKRGFDVSVFDKFYDNNPNTLAQSYDFVCATEVAEHLRQPGLSLLALWQLVLPEGYLALMTKRVLSREAFSRWHYKNDPTHISFFSDASFEWLAANLNARLEFVGKDVVFLQKRG